MQTWTQTASKRTPEPLDDEFPADPANIATRSATIMVVDDEPIVVKVLCKFLREAGYENFLSTSSSPEAVEIMRSGRPDLVLLDYMMPKMNGLEVLATMRSDERLRHIPAIFLTASRDSGVKLEALELHVSDFLSKPVDPNELVPRIRNALIVKAHRDHLQKYSERLEGEVVRRTGELETSRIEVILCLARAAEFRDDDTGHHVVRVGQFASIIATQLGFDRKWVELIGQAAQLHDVGKIAVPDDILKKPGKLDPDEFGIMQRHCNLGKSILQPLADTEWQTLQSHTQFGAKIMEGVDSPILALATSIAMTHHERWDGTGYPLGLAGEAIPIEGRITAVADVFDALSSKRPYKPPFPHEKCLAILEEGRGTQFDPTVLDAFLARIDEIAKTLHEYSATD